MSMPRVATQDGWLVARERLQTKESELTRARESITAERRRLPMVEITRGYTFDGPKGRVGLLDLFEGRHQLIVYHFWFQPGEEPCEGCSLWVSNLGRLANLHERDTSLAMVSPAPSADIEKIKQRRGWTMPWLSAIGENFNADAGYVGEAQLTVFVRDGEKIYRTYTVSGRTLETVSNHWTLLDLTPRGA